jgi:tetratricopeptide (TPR) repeat protein
VTLGNIQSFYGRMARREGRFDKAIEFFESAIRHYGKRDPRHPNLARSLANMALAKRGIALQLQKRIDRDVQRRRKTPQSGSQGKPSPSRHDYRGRLPSFAAKRSSTWMLPGPSTSSAPTITESARFI